MKHRALRKQLVNGLHLLTRLKEKGIKEHELEADLSALDRLLEQKNYEEATPHAERIAARLKESHTASLLSKTFEFVASIIAAVLIAGIIRQCWFELYEIPNWLMRPTFKEKDRVLVSKTTFGLNIPFTPGHVLFS